jgi:hypothetical protein
MLSYKTRMIHTVCFLPISNIKLFEFVAVVYWFVCLPQVWYIVGLCACLKCGISWVCVLASSVVYRGFVCLPQVWYIVGLSSSQVKPKTMKLVFAALRCRIKYWLAWNQDNVSEWGDMSIRGLLFQWARIIKIQLSLLV